MKSLYLLTIVASLLVLTQAAPIIDKQALKLANSQNDPSDIPADFPEFKEGYIDNKFNHFDPMETRTYKQRYFESSKFWDTESGPIFIYICGEYTCTVPTTRMFPYKMVEEHKGLYFVVEHRYYGKSQLFDDWSVENMRLLTLQLGLADLAYFIETVQKAILAEFPNNNGGKKRKVITIGGSYPGAMSAWFRYKYPHVTDGSLSSSGVIKPIQNFWQYDEQMNEDMKRTPDCLELAGSWVKHVYDSVTGEDEAARQSMFTLFKAGSAYSSADLMQFVSDTWGGNIQYGGRSELCAKIVALKGETFEDQLKGFAKITGEAGNDPLGGITSTKIDFNASGRQWTWQVCTQVGWLMTAAKNSVLTTDLTGLDYQLKTCERVFGVKLNPKDYIDELNDVLMGDIEMRGSNIFFTNGYNDGWQWAGMRSIEHKNSSMYAHVVKCDNCAHCVDLYTESKDDSEDLVNTRKEIRKHVAKWLQGEGFPEDSEQQSRRSLKWLAK